MTKPPFDPEKPDLLHATGEGKPQSKGYGVWVFIAGVLLIFALAFAFWP